MKCYWKIMIRIFSADSFIVKIKENRTVINQSEDKRPQTVKSQIAIHKI